MKPSHIAFGFAGIALIIGGAFALKGKLDYDRDGREITRLIGEYKAMGVPTNGTEYFHKIPDSENAWIELAPVFFRDGKLDPSTARPQSSLGTYFIGAATTADIPLLTKYLEGSRETRSQITTILNSKPNFQVPHNYDEGPLMLFSELYIFKQVSTEFCASALANAMKGNIQLALTDLETATKFANHGVDRGEWLSTIVSISIRYQINRTCLRIVEIRPEMTDQIRAFITAERRFVQPNFVKLFESTFLDQISGCRVFDIPKMDSRAAPFPLSLLVKEVDSNENEYEGVIAKSGDYIPKSPAMRHYLREKLLAWKPFMTKLLDPKNAGYQPNFLDYAPISQVLTNSPAPFKKLAGDEFLMGSDEEAFRNLLKPKLNDQASKIVWWGIGQHRKTGRFPPSLQGQNFSTDAFDSLGGIVYSSSVSGLILKSKKLEDDGQPKFQMSFPVSFGRSTATSRKQIDDYRKGKIDRKGTPL